jgi:hypothetical protein
MLVRIGTSEGFVGKPDSQGVSVIDVVAITRFNFRNKTTSTCHFRQVNECFMS